MEIVASSWQRRFTEHRNICPVLSEDFYAAWMFGCGSAVLRHLCVLGAAA